MKIPNTPLFVKTHDFNVWLLNHTRRFPKHFRYSLTQRIENLALGFEQTLLQANGATQLDFRGASFQSIPLNRDSFPGFRERQGATRRFVAHEYRRLEPCRSLDLTVCRLKAGLQTQDTSIAEKFLRLRRWVRVSDYRVPEYRPAAIAECEKDELRNSTHDTIENRYRSDETRGRGNYGGKNDRR